MLEKNCFSILGLKSTGCREKMAKMHSRAKGRARPRKPAIKTKSIWLRYKPKEIELLVTKLAKEGRGASEIGLVLRDSYGVPDVRTAAGKRITEILQEKSLLGKIPEDLLSLMKRSVLLRKHLDRNKKDMPATRGLHLMMSKIKRLAKYYKAEGKLALDWKYDADSIRLLAE